MSGTQYPAVDLSDSSVLTDEILCQCVQLTQSKSLSITLKVTNLSLNEINGDNRNTLHIQMTSYSDPRG